MSRFFQLLLSFSCVLALFATCATRSRRGGEARYPPRRPGCALRVFYSDLPEVAGWDPLGKVEIICNIDDTEKTCFGRMRAEVCRMGGDIAYHLPRKLWRPRDEAMGFRALVAHSRPVPEKQARPATDEEGLPPPASAEESAGPVVPLTGPGAPRVTRDAVATPTPTPTATDGSASGG